MLMENNQPSFLDLLLEAHIDLERQGRAVSIEFRFEEEKIYEAVCDL